MALTIRPQDKTAAQRTADDLSGSLQAGYAGLRGTFLMLSRLVWRNPYRLTPQQVLDLLGSDAAKLFAVSNAAVELLNLVGEGIESVVPEGWNYTINPDGTITLTGPAGE